MAWPPKDAPKSSAAKALALAIPQLRDSLSHVDVYLAAGALAGLGGAFHAFAGFGAHLLAERAGMNSMGAGWMVSAMAAGFAVGAAYWGKVADDTARRLSAAVTAPFGAVIAWGWLAAFPPSSPVLLCMALAACGWASASLSLAYPMLGELCRGKPQGAIKAAANCGIPLGAAAAQLVQGFLDARSCALPCLALSVLGAACFIAMAIRMRGAAVAEAAAPSASAAPAA
jgi:predicted MFS family arabinose efflux permease